MGSHDETIAVSAPPFTLSVSAWDARFPPVHSRRILCFRLSDSSHKDEVRSILARALETTVQELPFLAGNVVPPSGFGVEHWRRVIEPSGKAFIRFHDASALMPQYDKLAASGFPQTLLSQELCPFSDILHNQATQVPVCGLQANFIKGGLLLVISIINIAGDGRAISNMIEVFARHVRASQSMSTSFPQDEDVKRTYHQDRTLYMSGFGAPGRIENHAAWTAEALNAHNGLMDVPTRRRNVFITADSLKALKTALSPLDGSWISTHDAIIAFMWRTIMNARYNTGVIQSPTATTTLTTAVDCRRHLGLPEPYFGVAIYAVQVTATLDSLSSTQTNQEGLRCAARNIRSEINGVTGDDMRDLVGFVERTGHEQHTRLAVLQDMTTTGLLFVSHWRFNSWNLDFGPAFGLVQTVRHPELGLLPGMPTLLPRAKDGSAEILLNEQQSVMEALQKDETFTMFCSIGG